MIKFLEENVGELFMPIFRQELLDVKPKAWSLKNSDKFTKMNPFVPEKMTLMK